LHGRRTGRCKDCDENHCMHFCRTGRCKDCGTGHCMHGRRTGRCCCQLSFPLQANILLCTLRSSFTCAVAALALKNTAY
jgi:hypothetical protein